MDTQTNYTHLLDILSVLILCNNFNLAAVVFSNVEDVQPIKMFFFFEANLVMIVVNQLDVIHVPVRSIHIAFIFYKD